MKTVKVRIALAVDWSGYWNAVGWSNSGEEPSDKEAMDICIDNLLEEGEARFWVEVEVPIPTGPQVVVGNAVSAV